METNGTSAPARQLDRLEEALWVAQAQAGDTDAFLQLIKRYERPLLYYLRRLVPNGDSALDLHQEIWVDVFRGLSSLQFPEAFRAWLYRIAHHKAARFVRTEIRQEELQQSLAGDQLAEFDLPDDGWDAEAVHKG